MKHMLRAICLCLVCTPIAVMGQAPSLGVAPTSLLPEVKASEEREQTTQPTVEISSEDLTGVSPEKRAFIEAHPEQYMVVEKKSIDQSASQPTERSANQAPKVISYSEFLAMPASKQEQVLRYPAAFEITGASAEQLNNMSKVLPGNPSDESNITVTRDDLQNVSPSKREYIQGHPGKYTIVDGPAKDQDYQTQVSPQQEPPRFVQEVRVVEVDRASLQEVSEEKRDYILSHPEQYQVVDK